MKTNKSGALAAKVLVVVFACAVFYSFISLQVKIDREKESISELKQEELVKTMRNEKLMDLLTADVDEEFIEETARDKLGYALPGERYFEDISSK